MRLCLESKIILLYLPPHTSHILQPLDLSPFGALKALFHKAARQIIKSGDISRISKADFIRIYFEIRPRAFSKSNVEGGWRKSGIYPRDNNQPLSTPFLKEQIARQSNSAAQAPLKTTELKRGESVELDERDARTQIRDLHKQIKDLEAKNALLTTQLSYANEHIAKLKTNKKRKKIKVDSNQKLADFKGILGTQLAQDLEEEEEAKRAKRRAKRAKKN